MEFIDSGLFWLIIGGMMLLMGLITPGATLLFFAVGALLVAGLNFYYPFFIVYQLVIFVAISLLLLMIYRKITTGSFASGDEVDAVIIAEGTKAKVVEQIAPPAIGRVEVDGRIWQATADVFIEEGAVVSVVRCGKHQLHVCS